MLQPEISPYLDNPAATEVDKSDLARILADFPSQLENASQEFAKIRLPANIINTKQVVFCGMGGSASGAQLGADLPAGLARKPVHVIRDYDLPAWLDQDTVVVVISYSGETAEALACFDQASSQTQTVIVVTSGGELAKRAQANGAVLYQFAYEAPPRDALGYLFAPVVIILEQTGVLQKKEAELTPAIKLITELAGLYSPKIATAQNPAKQLAYRLFDRVPIIIGSNITRSVARRWKNQFNEHAKTASWFDELPEANHNTVEGFNLPARFKDDVVIIFLESNFDHPEVIKRQSLWREHLKGHGVETETIEAKGGDIWSNKLSLTYLGDWASYYLALLQRLDPEAIQVIKELKRKLGAS